MRSVKRSIPHTPWHKLTVFINSKPTLDVAWHKDSNYCVCLRCNTCPLTHWSRVIHICVSKLTIIGSDNGLSPYRRQAIFWTNDGLLLIVPLGTNFSEILCEIHTSSFKKMRLKVSSDKWLPFCPVGYEPKFGYSPLGGWKLPKKLHWHFNKNVKRVISKS